MAANLFYSVKDFSKELNYALAYYFYKVCLEADCFRRFEETQHLYNALVRALNLEEHSRKVVAAVIKQHKKNKKLTPKKK